MGERTDGEQGPRRAGDASIQECVRRPTARRHDVAQRCGGRTGSSLAPRPPYCRGNSWRLLGRPHAATRDCSLPLGASARGPGSPLAPLLECPWHAGSGACTPAPSGPGAAPQRGFRMALSAPRSVLIVKLAAIGDVVMALPMVTALRAQDRDDADHLALRQDRCAIGRIGRWHRRMRRRRRRGRAFGKPGAERRKRS